MRTLLFGTGVTQGSGRTMGSDPSVKTAPEATSRECGLVFASAGRRRNAVPLEKHERAVLRGWLNARRIHFDENLEGAHRTVRQQVAAKRDGMKRGRPDFEIYSVPPLAPDVRGVAIELKRQQGGRLSEDQRVKLEMLEADGWRVFVARGADAAIWFLEGLGFAGVSNDLTR